MARVLGSQAVALLLAASCAVGRRDDAAESDGGPGFIGAGAFELR